MKPLLCLIVCAATEARGYASGFQLGVTYSEWLNLSANSGVQIATDSSGSVYILSRALALNVVSSTVMKLSPDGKTLVWRNPLGFAASAMAVDPGGGVYVAQERQPGDAAASVAKLGAAGTGLAWKIDVGFMPQSPPVLAADSQGRVYLAAQSASNDYVTKTATVARVNAAGTAVEYSVQVMGTPSSIALDPSGAAFVAGSAVSAQGVTTGFLAQVAPDGTPGYYSFIPAGLSQTVAVDAAGDVVLFGLNTVERIDAAGAVTGKTVVGGPAVSFALDAAGNAYLAVVTNQLYPVLHSLATCPFSVATVPPDYAQLLTVIAPDGSLLQTTYLPGGDRLGSPQIATGPDSSVFVVATVGPSFRPTQAGPFPAGATGDLFLTSLSPHAVSPTYPLACAGSAASFAVGAISPGELVTLFGSGLGPLTGVQPAASLQTPYPVQAAGTEVTFDGTPAALLWVQDSQINLVIPRSLTPGRNTQVCVSSNMVATNCLEIPVAPTTPAVFMADTRYAAALNQDGSVNSAANPAAPGSIVTVFATGLGPVTPAPPEGALAGFPLPTNDLTFGVEAIYTLGIPTGVEVDVPFEVEYEGPAPFLVEGVSQINFRIAPYASYGAVYVHLGSTFSPGFTIHLTGQ